MNTLIKTFYVIGGTLRHDAPSCLVRQADSDLHAGLSAGEFCYVLTARQMGKSSLMVHTAARLRQQGLAVAVLDLTSVGQNLAPDQWYGGLLRSLGYQLDSSGALEEELDAFWLEQEHLGPLQRWMAALREQVLPRVPGRIAVFVDEIDVVRSLRFSTDEFFAAIRACYNYRTEDPAFSRLTFCLLGVASPSDLIRDARMTPFNIGRRIELTDFTKAEAVPLARGFLTPPPNSLPEAERGSGTGLSRVSISGRGRGRGSADELFHRILYWTHGYPHPHAPALAGLPTRQRQVGTPRGAPTAPSFASRSRRRIAASTHNLSSEGYARCSVSRSGP